MSDESTNPAAATLVAEADMRIQVVKREINQGALAGLGSEISDYAAALVVAALDSFDERPRDYDNDPAALAWARANVQRYIDQAAEFAAKRVEEGKDPAPWRQIANFMRSKMIGGTGCVIAAFDERRPAFSAAIARAIRPVDSQP
jgi:hypothetical protein